MVFPLPEVRPNGDVHLRLRQNYSRDPRSRRRRRQVELMLDGCPRQTVIAVCHTEHSNNRLPPIRGIARHMRDSGKNIGTWTPQAV